VSKNKNENKNDSSNLKTITDLPKSRTKAELQRQVGDLMVMIDGQNREIQRLETDLEASYNKVLHLEKILQHSVPKLGEGDQIQLDEVTIAQMQLQILGKLAAQRELNNEEARRFEIFSRVIQNDAKIEKKHAPKSPLKDVTPAKLLELATAKPKED
jgi:hypothetical protein